jgi:hypothetical protein
MEESALAQMEEDVGALATLRSFVNTFIKDDGGTRGPACTLSENLGMNGFKKGAEAAP